MAQVLTVFFEGTANPLALLVTQIGLFAQITEGVNLASLLPGAYDPSSSSYVLAFDGCGVTNGLSGVLFAQGLSSQCRIVRNHVNYLLSSSHPLTVNAVGLSRGGIAVIYLAQMLQQINTSQLQLNLLLFDPVPGNLIWSTRYLDLCHFTTAGSAMDLSGCRHLYDVLALYPYLPLPDLAFHAPIFPKYPSYCHEVVEDACLGCHQGALFCQPLVECRLSFTRMREWLLAHGTTFNKRYGNLVNRLLASPAECLEMMTNTVAAAATAHDQEEVVRSAHSKPSGAVIRRHSVRNITRTPAGAVRVYLNHWHRHLSLRGESDSHRASSRLLLEISRR
jgi:hypothetical protein